MQTLRYWDYYGMTETFTDLYDRALKQETFKHLYDMITSRENILLAYRTIKSNDGSKTAGTDGKTIIDIEKRTENELVTEIQNKLKNYRPKKVRRKYIKKENGKLRPLGIPCILDRIIQQCFKQVLVPIVEAQFYNHSFSGLLITQWQEYNISSTMRLFIMLLTLTYSAFLTILTIHC